MVLKRARIYVLAMEFVVKMQRVIVGVKTANGKARIVVYVNVLRKNQPFLVLAMVHVTQIRVLVHVIQKVGIQAMIALKHHVTKNVKQMDMAFVIWVNAFVIVVGVVKIVNPKHVKMIVVDMAIVHRI